MSHTTVETTILIVSQWAGGFADHHIRISIPSQPVQFTAVPMVTIFHLHLYFLTRHCSQFSIRLLVIQFFRE